MQKAKWRTVADNILIINKYGITPSTDNRTGSSIYFIIKQTVKCHGQFHDDNQSIGKDHESYMV